MAEESPRRITQQDFERLTLKLLKQRGLARPVDTASSEYLRLRDEAESTLQRLRSAYTWVIETEKCRL